MKNLYFLFFILLSFASLLEAEQNYFRVIPAHYVDNAVKSANEVSAVGLNVYVTGCSRGQGKWIVKEFITRGANVYCNARTKGIKALGYKYFVGDITNEIDMDKIVLYFKLRNITINIFIGNAGELGSIYPQDFYVNGYEYFDNNNMDGNVRLHMKFMRAGVIKPKGAFSRVGFTSSIGAITYFRPIIPYGASKKSIEFYTWNMAMNSFDNNYDIRYVGLFPFGVNSTIGCNVVNPPVLNRLCPVQPRATGCSDAYYKPDTWGSGDSTQSWEVAKYWADIMLTPNSELDDTFFLIESNINLGFPPNFQGFASTWIENYMTKRPKDFYQVWSQTSIFPYFYAPCSTLP